MTYNPNTTSTDITDGTIAYGDLSTALTLDNLATNRPATASITANTNKITNVTDPTAAQDAATKNYVDNRGIDSHAGLYVVGPAMTYAQQSFVGNNGLGAQGSCAIRFTPTKTIAVASYSLYCATAPTSTGSIRMTVYASDGSTLLTSTATDGTTRPVSGTISVTTSTTGIITGTLSANTGSGSLSTLTLTAGTTYWIGVFFNTQAVTATYSVLDVPSLFGTTITTADCWFRSITVSGQTLVGGAVDTVAPLIALKT